MSTGAPTSCPDGTSMKTGSAANASLRRTRASPPSWTAPSMSAAPGTSSARPKSNVATELAPSGPDVPAGPVAVKALARPLCTSTLPAISPSAVESAASSWSPAGTGPSPPGGAKSSRTSVSMGVYRQTSSLSDGQRARGEGVVTGSPPFPEPLRSGQGRGSLSGEGVQGHVLFQDGQCGPCTLLAPRCLPYQAD